LNSRGSDPFLLDTLSGLIDGFTPSPYYSIGFESSKLGRQAVAPTALLSVEVP
jgi:hypothetical protein